MANPVRVGTSSLLNASAAFVAAGVVDTLEDGLERAALTIDAGLTAQLLECLRNERRTAAAASGGPVS